MSFLRRIFGGGHDTGDDDPPARGDDGDAGIASDPDVEERRHELDVLRAEADRLDELTNRQLKYADYAWRPPDQGGERRADDVD